MRNLRIRLVIEGKLGHVKINLNYSKSLVHNSSKLSINRNYNARVSLFIEQIQESKRKMSWFMKSACLKGSRHSQPMGTTAPNRKELLEHITTLKRDFGL